MNMIKEILNAVLTRDDQKWLREQILFRFAVILLIFFITGGGLLFAGCAVFLTSCMWILADKKGGKVCHLKIMSD